jgi:hypothetical protein
VLASYKQRSFFPLLPVSTRARSFFVLVFVSGLLVISSLATPPDGRPAGGAQMQQQYLIGAERYLRWKAVCSSTDLA